jgi:glutathione S-transferase
MILFCDGCTEAAQNVRSQPNPKEASVPSATRVLYIGDRRYSSWSLRPFMALSHAGLSFEPRTIRLRRPETKAEILAVSPNGRVPCLIDDGLVVFDSLAICDYAAELAPDAQLWPSDRAARAHARSISSEMHSGFSALRQALPMDLQLHQAPDPSWGGEVLADIARIVEIWTTTRARYGAGGPYLFGHFTIADAMYAPVVTRFKSYGVAVDAATRAYMDAIFAHKGMVTWAKDAAIEDASVT